jgi:hypothetical protein
MCLVISSNTYKSVSMRVTLFVMIALFMFDAAASTPVETVLYAEQWELARNGERLLGIDGLSKVVTEWSSNDGQQIELQYPGGEEGEIWVSQLMDWLVALGVPSASLVAVPGSGQGDAIRLRVIRAGENFR